eukprot:UN05495
MLGDNSNVGRDSMMIKKQINTNNNIIKRKAMPLQPLANKFKPFRKTSLVMKKPPPVMKKSTPVMVRRESPIKNNQKKKTSLIGQLHQKRKRKNSWI